MKLIHKTARYYLIYALFIFGLGTVFFYFVIRIILIDSIDEAIHQEKIQLIDNLKYENVLDELRPSENVDIKHTALRSEMYDRYSTVQVYDSTQSEWVDYRQLKSIHTVNGQFYEISIRQSMSEAESLLNGILPAEIALFLLFLIGVLLMNNYVNRTVWEPFYVLLEKIKAYDFEKTKVIAYESSGINEFQELSRSIEKMTSKIYRDFINQKEFNENSSHELQTPLAIIRNKLELLIQSKNLKEEDMKIIESVFEAVKRLTLLNKGLILIAQIDNHQFSGKDSVYLGKKIEHILKNFEHQVVEKQLELSTSIDTNSKVYSNTILVEILLNNLLSNAIKHNVVNGQLNVRFENGLLQIENTGKPLSVDTQKLFDRFKKDSDSEQSIGLGLAIVNKICSLLGHTIRYTNRSTLHLIEVDFENSKKVVVLQPSE